MELWLVLDPRVGLACHVDGQYGPSAARKLQLIGASYLVNYSRGSFYRECYPPPRLYVKCFTKSFWAFRRKSDYSVRYATWRRVRGRTQVREYPCGMARVSELKGWLQCPRPLRGPTDHKKRWSGVWRSRPYAHAEGRNSSRAGKTLGSIGTICADSFPLTNQAFSGHCSSYSWPFVAKCPIFFSRGSAA